MGYLKQKLKWSFLITTFKFQTIKYSSISIVSTAVGKEERREKRINVSCFYVCYFVFNFIQTWVNPTKIVSFW